VLCFEDDFVIYIRVVCGHRKTVECHRHLSGRKLSRLSLELAGSRFLRYTGSSVGNRLLSLAAGYLFISSQPPSLTVGSCLSLPATSIVYSEPLYRVERVRESYLVVSASCCIIVER